MLPAASNQVTQPLARSRDGDPTAQESLILLVYDELRGMARSTPENTMLKARGSE